MQLTDTQLVVLSAALARDDASILPLPPKLKGGAVAKVCAALLAKGLAQEGPLSAEEVRAHPDKVFRKGEDGKTFALVPTDLARKALNVEPEEISELPVKEEAAPAAKGGRKAPRAAAPPAREEEAERAAESEDGKPKVRAAEPRAGTKLDRLIELLRRPEGVSIKEAAEALDWMQHSVRGAVAGALKKKYGLTIASEKVEGRGTVYRVGS